jgi:hypothetical protein
MSTLLVSFMALSGEFICRIQLPATPAVACDSDPSVDETTINTVILGAYICEPDYPTA